MGAAEQFEVEGKFPVRDHAAVEAKLRALGAEFGPAQTQIDRYLAHPSRDFRQTDEALRLRRVDEACYVTYKGPKLDPRIKTRYELELPLGQGAETIEHFSELFTRLGFRAVTEVRKQRREAAFSWQGKSITAALDTVDQVGAFVELEMLATADERTAAGDLLIALGDELELGPIERRSYLHLLLVATGVIDGEEGK